MPLKGMAIGDLRGCLGGELSFSFDDVVRDASARKVKFLSEADIGIPLLMPLAALIQLFEIFAISGEGARPDFGLVLLDALIAVPPPCHGLSPKFIEDLTAEKVLSMRSNRKYK